jgi:putative restriction endonuclease
VCSLSRRALLDAAHIIEDGDPEGVAAVSNGLSLCKIHHSAYDQNLLGIDPDLRVHIAQDLLDEIDGPMLQHGLKEMHGRKLLALPSEALDYPARDRLGRRFDEFRLAQ